MSLLCVKCFSTSQTLKGTLEHGIILSRYIVLRHLAASDKNSNWLKQTNRNYWFTHLKNTGDGLQARLIPEV